MKTLLYVYPSSLATNKLEGAVPDLVVIDLEESVPAVNKQKARLRLCETVAAFATLGLRTVVRVNGADTPNMANDLDAVARLDPAVGLLLPKPLDERVIGNIVASNAGRPLWLMAESKDTPCWLPAVLERHRIDGLVIGGKDLCLDLRLSEYAPDDARLRSIIAQVVAIARPLHVDVFDAVEPSISAVRQAAARAEAAGCAGMSFVDPAQIRTLQATG